MCGTDSPIKAIGPQKAVETATSTPVINNTTLRNLIVLMPRFSAYSSPSIKTLRGFINSADEITDSIIIMENIVFITRKMINMFF